MHKNMGIKLIILSDFGYISNILALPSIIYVDKQSIGCKILSLYFSKCSQYTNTGPTDISIIFMIIEQLCKLFNMHKF